MPELHLIQLPLRQRAFTKWALDRRFLRSPPGDGRGRPRVADEGYALHAVLAAMFGEQAPRPFYYLAFGQGSRSRSGYSYSLRPGEGYLLGYSRVSLGRLKALAQLSFDESHDLVNWDGARSKPLPLEWPSDLRMRFDLRACPVRRLARPLTTSAGPNLDAVTVRKGGEVDAYQCAAVRARDRGDPVPSRDQAYVEWLQYRFKGMSHRQAVHLLPRSVRVESFRSTRLLRRPPRAPGGRPAAKWLTRPDVHFSGLIEITGPRRFSELLLRGIGRHCGFGFGMLRLRPA